MSIHEIFKRKLVPIGFERTMGLLGATTLGIGALMGAGIYVLIGLAAGHAGPAIWLSYLVCGLLSLLSVLVFGELSRRMPITGGGYAFVYNSLGSFWGFLTGWLLAVGSIFACAMYAIGFAYYFTSLFPHHFPESVIKGIALVVIAFLTLINCRGTKGGNRVQKFFTWGNLLVLLCLILLSIPKAEPERLKPVFSQGLNGLGGAMGVGVLIYFLYSRKREIRSRTGLSLVLSGRSTPKVLAGSRILVPMANPQSQQALFSISDALLAKQRGEVVALTVVETPDQLDFHAAFDDVQSSLEILERSTQLPSLYGVNIRPVVRLSRSLPKGIVHAAEEEGCDLIVMGYAGEESPKSIQLMEEVLSHARTDTILLKLRGDFCPKRIAVSLGGSINLDLMVRLAGAVADRFGGGIIFLNVLPTNYTPEQKAHSGKILVEAIKHHVAKALYKIEVESSDEPLEFLLKRSRGFDLLIVGATKVGLLERAVVGTFSSQIAIRSECAVAVVRAAPLTRKWLSI